MYIRVTPRQLKKLKDFMKTVKLQAYDITIYNEILKGLDNPIEELQKDKKNSSISETEIKHIQNKVVSTPYNKEPAKIIEQKDEYELDLKSEPELVKDIDDILDEYVEEEKQVDIQQKEHTGSIFDTMSLDELDNIGPMSVIDRRTKRAKTESYY